MRTNLSFLPLLVLLISHGHAYTFPIGFSKVDQTYGDFNGSTYHDGVDFPGNTVGQVVLSPIPSGILLWKHPSYTDNGYVCVMDANTSKIFMFGHIDLSTSVVSVTTGTLISQNTPLGTLQDFPYNPYGNQNIVPYPHLHSGVSLNNDALCGLGEAEDPLSHFSPVTQSLTLNATDIIPIPDLFTSTAPEVLEGMFDEFSVGGGGLHWRLW